jgi:hypothetical protein
MNYVRKVRRGDCRRFLLLNIRLKYINTQFVTLWHQTYRRSKCAISTKFQLRVIRWVHKLFKWPLLLCHPKKSSFKMTITQTLMKVRGMKITPLLCYPTITTWHNSHHLPLHNSSALSPVHELFKRPSYTGFYTNCGHDISHVRSLLGNTLVPVPCLLTAYMALKKLVTSCPHVWVCLPSVNEPMSWFSWNLVQPSCNWRLPHCHVLKLLPFY